MAIWDLNEPCFVKTADPAVLYHGIVTDPAAEGGIKVLYRIPPSAQQPTKVEVEKVLDPQWLVKKTGAIVRSSRRRQHMRKQRPAQTPAVSN